MAYQRILTIQDISCVGQCSLTVALPILSACGLETSILPSAVLSTHTGGFSGFTFRDLTEDVPAILRHWKQEGLDFAAIYTGYLGSREQIALVQKAFETVLMPGGKIIVDPAMADGGKLYKGFDEAYASAMRELCARADVILPNMTEACLLAGEPYLEQPTEADILRLCEKLTALGAREVVLTGASAHADRTGAALYSEGVLEFAEHEKLPGSYHGTGDIFASVFTGCRLQGMDAKRAALTAGSFVCRSIANTPDDPKHRYGVRFETALPQLVGQLADYQKNG